MGSRRHDWHGHGVQGLHRVERLQLHRRRDGRAVRRAAKHHGLHAHHRSHVGGGLRGGQRSSSSGSASACGRLGQGTCTWAGAGAPSRHSSQGASAHLLPVNPQQLRLHVHQRLDGPLLRPPQRAPLPARAGKAQRHLLESVAIQAKGGNGVPPVPRVLPSVPNSRRAAPKPTWRSAARCRQGWSWVPTWSAASAAAKAQVGLRRGQRGSCHAFSAPPTASSAPRLRMRLPAATFHSPITHNLKGLPSQW